MINLANMLSILANMLSKQEEALASSQDWARAKLPERALREANFETRLFDATTSVRQQSALTNSTPGH